MNCKSCKYHQPAGVNEEQIAVGHCYRYPPVPLSATQSTVPPVNSDKGRCGEFKRKWFGK